jgi:putative hydrolases of HD superfamily
MDPFRLHDVVAFIQSAALLKDTLRTGKTVKGRPESVADHSWRLSLMVMMFERELPECDMLRMLKLCLVHDLGEAISGDIPAPHQMPGDDKSVRERSDLAALCAPLPEDLQQEIVGLWDEYDAGATPEAKLVKGFDKLETMLQHAIGRNAPDFDYAFNLTYGLTQTEAHPLSKQIRALVDECTRRRRVFSNGEGKGKTQP